jgi:AcrR family transcriptional regulator
VRHDALRNYERVLDAARDLFGESGADACMEDIAARAGVGVGTVYRRFASKDALIDELLRLAVAELITASESALARTDGSGLEFLVRAFGRSFADHAHYADLLLDRQPDPAVTRQLRAAMAELTARATAAGTVSRSVTTEDVIALISAMRGLVKATAKDAPVPDWQRFLDLHLAGMRAGSTPAVGVGAVGVGGGGR